MEDTILFTIIIPHYNTPNFLMRLLVSIDLHEDFIQVIVVDDQSNIELNQLAKCKQFCRTNGIEFYNNDGKKGAGACRNIGLKHARGKWILFADADDIFMPGFKNKIFQYANSSADIVFFEPTSLEEDTGKISVRHLAISKYVRNYKEYPNGHKEIVELKYHNVVPWSKIIRHSVISENNILFDEILYSNDMMFSMKVAWYSQKIEASSEAIYCCMRNGKSLTANISPEVYIMRREVWIERYEFLKGHLSSEDFAILNLSGASYIFTGLSNKVGWIVLLNTINKFIKHHIKIIPRNLLNRDYLQNHFMTYIREWEGSKKYYYGRKK